MIINCKGIIPLPIPENLIKQSEVWAREFSINDNEKVLIYAESGKGKTTLLNIILGTRKDYNGELCINNKNIKEHSNNELSELRRNKFSVVPQGLLLFNDLSVIENITIKNRILNFLSNEEIESLLEKFGIIDQRNKRVKFISYGQKQRLAIIRAMCQDFRFLLMDEPFSHLDEKNREIVWETVNYYADKQNAGIIMTSLHDDLKFDFNKKMRV
jgi:putative ABC transport system ATP-binding protein